MILKLAKLGDGPEIFHTIQGEGVSAGTPAVFVRTSRCNLHCVWCDTDHTWNFEGTAWPHEKDHQPGYQKHRKEDVTCRVLPEEAAQLVLSHQCPRIVITGGEPLLQEAALLEMIRHIRRKMPGAEFEVETNGTRMAGADFKKLIYQFNISPKLSNAGMSESMRIHPKVMQSLLHHPNAWFKFVVQSDEDLQEIKQLEQEVGIPRTRILLMPEGRTPQEMNESAVWLAELCRRDGYRYCDRLHIRLWGDRRGV